MKKIVLCILIICAIFSVSSCKNENINSETDKSNNNTFKEIIMEDWYFFSPGKWTKTGINYETIEGYGPFKINPATKIASFICADPLCNHSIDCPFYNCNDSYVTSNYVFYTVGYISDLKERVGDTVSLRVYDMLNNTVREIAEYRDNIYFFPVAAGNYLYYYVYQYIEDANGGSEKYSVFRADAKIGNTIEIPLYGNDYSDKYTSLAIYAIYNNKIYWEKNSRNGAEHYTTDFDGNNKQMIDYGIEYLNLSNNTSRFADGYIYYLYKDTEAFLQRLLDSVNNPNSTPLSAYEYDLWERVRALYKIPLDGNGETALIAEDIFTFVICGDKIYYTAIEDDPVPVYYGDIRVKDTMGAEVWNWSGGKVYVMNSDGTDQKLLCETELDIRLGFSDLHNAKTINDVDYIGLPFNVIHDGFFSKVLDEYMENYHYYVSPDTLIINASTGEYTVVSVPE